MSYHQPQAAFYDSRAYDLPPTRSDDGAGGGQRQQPNYEPRGLMPLTIKQILQALPGDSGELVVRGRPLQQVSAQLNTRLSAVASPCAPCSEALPADQRLPLFSCCATRCLLLLQVRVVGQYAEESRRGSNAHFFIHDSTGQLSCTSSLEGNDAMVRVVERLQHLRSYVSVVGKVRPGNRMFVYHARILTDFNELIHHNIECIYEDLKAKAALASHGQAAAQPMQQPQQLPGHRVYPDKPVTECLSSRQPRLKPCACRSTADTSVTVPAVRFLHSDATVAGAGSGRPTSLPASAAVLQPVRCHQPATSRPSSQRLSAGRV